MMEIDYYELSQKLGQVLKQKGLKLVSAESCTGGGIAELITAVPGSSEWFDRGFVTYSNEAKIEMLGVKPETIEQHGAVSQATAQEMAEGALKHSRAQVSIAVTGIAGPGGGSNEKPVGSVWFGWSIMNNNTQTALKHFEGNRQAVRRYSINFALNQLLQSLNSNTK